MEAAAISFICGNLGCFHLLTIVNNTALNKGVHMSLRDPIFNFFFDVYQEAELLNDIIVLFLTFLGTSILFSIVIVPSYNPTNSAQRF